MTNQTRVDLSTLPVSRYVEVATVGVFTVHPELGVCSVFAVERKGRRNDPKGMGNPCAIFPTGQVENGEGTAIAAARESLEELGVKIPSDLPRVHFDVQYRTFDDAKSVTKYDINYFAVFLPWSEVLEARVRMANNWQELLNRKEATSPLNLNQEDLKPEEIFETVGMAILPLKGLDQQLKTVKEHKLRSVRLVSSIAKGYEPDDFAGQGSVIFTGEMSLNTEQSKEIMRGMAHRDRPLIMGIAHDHHLHIPFMLEFLQGQHQNESVPE